MAMTFLMVGCGNAIGRLTEAYFIENSYVCEKFFDVSTGMFIETNEQIAKAVERIHIYCPEERVFQDTISLSAIIAVFPQLREWDWNKDFIHTYQTKDGYTAYFYIKQIVLGNEPRNEEGETSTNILVWIMSTSSIWGVFLVGMIGFFRSCKKRSVELEKEIPAYSASRNEEKET